jgi:hypothetical protein
MENTLENIKFIFVSEEVEDYKSLEDLASKSNNMYFIKSLEDSEFTSFFTKDIPDKCILIIRDEKILEILSYPDFTLDWIDGFNKYLENNQLETQNEKTSLFAWGQNVHSHGEVLCTNCGYILEVEDGGTYPICPACSAGSPDSPSTPENPFWKKIA